MREMLACTRVVAREMERSDGCTVEAQTAGLADAWGWGERERGDQDDFMVFALSNQVDGGEYVLRWEELQFRRCGESFVLAKYILRRLLNI